MTARGIDFLENWIEGNVGEADKYGSHGRARKLAAKCAAEANALGVSIDAMEHDQGSLEKMIYEVMHHGFDG